MSGICGVLIADSQRVEPQTIIRMMNSVSYLGEESCSNWCYQNVGFGQQQSKLSNQQLSSNIENRQGDNLTLVADCVLNNRTELIENLLSLGYLNNSTPDDRTILLAAYRRWGKQCGEYILGDYAFALFDSNEKQLICIRDALGKKPLFYYFDGKKFAFASTIKQLVSCDWVTTEINRIAVAHYLTNKPIDYLYENTFYKNIYRMKPAHCLVVSADRGIESFRYWKIDNSLQDTHRTDQDYADEFLNLLQQCLGDYSDRNGKLGILTSGGMDSTSLVSTLAGDNGSSIKLFNISYGENHPQDESKYVAELANKFSLNLSLINGMDYLPFSAGLDAEIEFDEPPPYFDHLQWNATFKLAKQQGIDTLLGGFSGDGLFMVQPYAFMDYIKQGQILRAMQRFNSFVKLANLNNSFLTFSLISKMLISSTLPHSLLTAKHRMARDPDYLHPELLKDLKQIKNWKDPIDLQLGFKTSHQNRRYYFLTHQILNYLGFSQHLAAKHGLTMRDPFGDRRIIEHCLALPPDQCFNQGKNKYILRNAMKNILPDSIRLRSTKTDFRAILNSGITSFLNRNSSLNANDFNCVKDELLLAKYVENQLKLTKVGLQSTSNPYKFNSRQFSRILLLESWLTQCKNKS